MRQSVLRALLVDDEPRAREILRYYLGKIGGVEVVGEAGDGAEAARLAEDLDPDVVFLDVRMPEVDGMEAARLLRRNGGRRPWLVFVTAYEEHAVAAFEAEAVDYVVKPLTVPRLWQTVDRLRQRIAAGSPATVPPPPTGAPRPRRLPFTVAGPDRAQHTMFFEPAAILAVEAQGKNCLLWTRQARLPVLHSLSTLEALLPPGLFLRVHRSYLVNVRAIAELFPDGRTYGLKLEGCSLRIPVSRDKAAALRSALGLDR